MLRLSGGIGDACASLAVLSMVVLSIFLRQEGSPQSKLVNAPNAATGDDE